jgi:hypothetical protein
MERFTIRKDNVYNISQANMDKAIARLGAFEDAFEALLRERSEIPLILEGMREQGKAKTVRYKELIAQKLINSSIIMFFEKHGIE